MPKYDKDGNVIDDDFEEGDDFEDVSDEDFAKLTLEQFEGTPEGVAKKEEIEKDLDIETDLDKDDATLDPDLDDKDGADDEDKDPDDDLELDKEADPKDKDTDADEDDPEKKDEDSEIDYKAEYEKLMKGFDADGDVIVPKSVDDLITLAQQGVSARGKLKNNAPARLALKTLQNNGLTEAGALDFLIDLKKGNPEAIQKLLKDNKINPDDLDLEAESTYTPGNYQASEGEVKLDEVLDSIAGSKHEDRTLDVVTKQWDEASQRQAGKNPNIISVINSHMGNGVYDKVQQTVKYERSMGRLDGVTDFEAYMQTGEAMEKAGMLVDTVAPVKQAPVIADPAAEALVAKAAERMSAKKKATVTGNKRVAKKKLLTVDELSELSDEAFAKLDKKQYGL